MVLLSSFNTSLDPYQELVLETGNASYYDGKFVGRKTANGEIFSRYKFTCAHKSLPFGTKIKITNLENDLSIIAVVNDRGPFIRGRVVDLSLQGAMALNMVNDGVVQVAISLVDQDFSDLGLVQEMVSIPLLNSVAYVKVQDSIKINLLTEILSEMNVSKDSINTQF